jgi:release factor glutamine methyltransferase
MMAVTMKKQLFDELLQNIKLELNCLPDKPEESASATLKALWFAASGDAKSAQLAEQLELPDLDSEQQIHLEVLITQRLQGTPLAHITRRQQFMGIELIAGPDALIPRKETEILGKTALRLIQDILNNQESAVVVDVCTGAGNLPVAYAKHEPRISVFAADLCPKAVGLAKRNVELHNLHAFVEIREGDLMSPFDSEDFHNKVDVLTFNPPYISSAKVDVMHDEIRQHEPKLAFDGGPFGIMILNKMLKQAPRYLREGGWLAFEVGLGQGPAMVKRMSNNKSYADVQSVEDDNGDIRVVLARVSPQAMSEISA